MNSRIILISIFLSLAFRTNAQHIDDALRIMNENVTGSARTIGIGGAQSALGGDLGSFQFNPATIGIFRSSQVGLSTAIISNRNENEYNKDIFNANKISLVVNNFGIVFSTTDDENDKLKSISVGLSYHRKMNFKNDYSAKGFNTTNSFTTYFGEQTTIQTTENPSILNTTKYINKDSITTMPELLWISELIKDPINDSLFNGIANNGGLFQEFLFNESGYYNEWDFTVGGNYNDYIYFGAALGLHYYEYGYTKQIIETDTYDTIPNFTSFTYEDEYKIQGLGNNLKFGTVVRPTDWLRLGIAMETPTFFQLKSSQTISLIDVNITDDTTRNSSTDFKTLLKNKEVKFTSPMKYTFGMVIMLKKYGFISTDIEHINYSNSIFSLDNKVSSTLKNTYNFRIGAEGRYNKLRARIGFARNGNPYQDGNNSDQHYYSFGFGYKNEILFIDFAYLTSASNNKKSPYTLQNNTQPEFNINNRIDTYSVTLGATF